MVGSLSHLLRLVPHERHTKHILAKPFQLKEDFLERFIALVKVVYG